MLESKDKLLAKEPVVGVTISAVGVVITVIFIWPWGLKPGNDEERQGDNMPLLDTVFGPSWRSPGAGLTASLSKHEGANWVYEEL